MRKLIVLLLIIGLWGALIYELTGKNNETYEVNGKQNTGVQTNVSKTSQNDALKIQVDQLIKKNHFNGSVFVAYNNDTLLDQSYGFKDADQTKKFDENSMYLIGSCQKLITGIITKQLVDDRIINVDVPVKQYIPNFKYPNIKIKDLILHRSGLGKYTFHGDYHGLDASVDNINATGLGPVPHGSYLYNDANYILLAKVIENVTGKSYQQNVEQRIFKKYHLKESSFFDDEKLSPYFVKGLKYVNHNWKAIEPTGLDKFYGAGNIYMSPKDMGILLNDVMQYRVLSKSQLDSISKPMIFNINSKYRYGMSLKKEYYRSRGYFFGIDFVSLFNHNKVVVVATNKLTQNEIPNNEKLAQQIYSLLK